MTTLTITEARKNLSRWIRRAKAGEEIGIIDGNQIVALRPVTVTAVDFEEVHVDTATQKKMNAIASTWKRTKK